MLFGVGVPAVGKTPFSGNTPFSSQTGGKRVQNSSFRDISVPALQNAPCLHANHIKARSNGVFPTAEVSRAESGRVHLVGRLATFCTNSYVDFYIASRELVTVLKHYLAVFSVFSTQELIEITRCGLSHQKQRIMLTRLIS